MRMLFETFFESLIKIKIYNCLFLIHKSCYPVVKGNQTCLTWFVFHKSILLLTSCLSSGWQQIIFLSLFYNFLFLHLVKEKLLELLIPWHVLIIQSTFATGEVVFEIEGHTKFFSSSEDIKESFLRQIAYFPLFYWSYGLKLICREFWFSL